VAVAQRLLDSSEGLLEGVRTLLGLLNELKVDLSSSEHLGVLVAIDSGADEWLLGVEPALLGAAFRASRERQLHDYAEKSWPEVQQACREVLRLVGEHS